MVICRWNHIARHYAQYAPDYKRPVFRKDEVNAFVKETSTEEIDCMRVRAAEGHQTCSVFYDEDVSKFTNYIMKCGKKELARNLVENAFTHVKHIQIRKYQNETDEEKKIKILINPREVFHTAVINSTPKLDVTKIKKSGTWYHIPVGIKPKRAKFLAMKWLVEASREKEKNYPFEKQLATELIAAAEGHGKAVKKKTELHKLCEANRSYAHYRWT